MNANFKDNLIVLSKIEISVIAKDKELFKLLKKCSIKMRFFTFVLYQ